MHMNDKEVSYYTHESKKFESKRISNCRPRLHTFFNRLHQNTGDTLANCRIKWGISILLLLRGRPRRAAPVAPAYEYEYSY